MSDLALPPHTTRARPTRHLGRRILSFARLDSTNALALALADDPARHGLVLLADEQTAGRGQYGRSWQAPPGSGVLMSVLLFPPAELRRPALLVAWAAVAVSELVGGAIGIPATIKWPNDVLVRGKKVCGILIEQRNSGHPERPLATVVGMGLNVTQPAEAFAAAGLPDAASLLSLSGARLETGVMADRLIDQLDTTYDRLLAGDVAALESRWRAGLGLLGRPVRVEAIDGERHGRLVRLALDGLELDVGGRIVRLAPEVVRHITETGPGQGCESPG